MACSQYAGNHHILKLFLLLFCYYHYYFFLSNLRSQPHCGVDFSSFNMYLFQSMVWLSSCSRFQIRKSTGDLWKDFLTGILTGILLYLHFCFQQCFTEWRTEHVSPEIIVLSIVSLVAYYDWNSILYMHFITVLTAKLVHLNMFCISNFILW